MQIRLRAILDTCGIIEQLYIALFNGSSLSYILAINEARSERSFSMLVNIIQEFENLTLHSIYQST